MHASPEINVICLQDVIKHMNGGSSISGCEVKLAADSKQMTTTMAESFEEKAIELVATGAFFCPDLNINNVRVTMFRYFDIVHI